MTSGATGSGDGSVAFSYAANTGASRTGTLTIAGQTFTLTQAPCMYSISPDTVKMDRMGRGDHQRVDRQRLHVDGELQ